MYVQASSVIMVLRQQLLLKSSVYHFSSHKQMANVPEGLLKVKEIKYKEKNILNVSRK